jgi:hypothetical protein
LTAKRFTKKLTKIAAWILGGLVAMLVSFHFWFVHHAEELIETLVHDQSNGKVNLKVKKFKFNWFSRKMELQDAVFYSTDTITAPTAYRFKVDRLRIEVKKVLPIIFEKRFLIDSIHILNPDISVTRLRSVKDTSALADTGLSIPHEMGRIYNSIQDALQVLEVDRFQIDNGTFSLNNKISPDEKPIIISRLYFHLDNLFVDTTHVKAQKKILFSDNVALHTTNQDILFPDGRHRLSFSNFRINVRNRLAEFDSCTIIATKGDSANNSFRIFFDKLRMTNIDFDTLYHTEVIKADSVYCINPRFRLDVELEKRTGPVQPPKLNELIQQLTGNMQLAFVVVQNGSFDINTMREGRPSSFTSDHNNFELQGLRIQQNAPRPLTVERFAMAIRNYENFLRDSAYAIQFDSILLNNNRISLSNFTYKELKNNKIVNSLTVPQFELQGLSWDNLVFNQQLKAEKVNLYHPVINYNTKNRTRSQDIFHVLEDIGNVFQLNNLSITDGKVNLFLPNNSSLRLEGATMSVSGKQLVDSRKVASIQRSVNDLKFQKGTFTTPDWTAGLENVQFKGSNNGLKAGSIHVRGAGDLIVEAKGVAINSMIFDERFQHNTLKNIQWQQADISFSSLKEFKSAKGGLTLEQINGANTRITINQGNRKMAVSLKTLTADKLQSITGQPVEVTGFAATGNDLAIRDSTLQLDIKNLAIRDRQTTSLTGIRYASYTSHDSVHMDIPSMNLVPDINALIQGKIQADAITVSQPVIKINLFASVPSIAEKKAGTQNIFLGSMLIHQPVIHFLSNNEKGKTSLEWKGTEKDNSFELSNLKIDKYPAPAISADRLRFSMDHFQYINTKGKKFDAGNGQLQAQVNQLALQKNETDGWDWQGIISQLVARNFMIDSLGKKNGTLIITTARLNDLSVSSSLLLNMRDLINQNKRFNLKEVTGSYKNTEDQFSWFNAGYDKQTKFFSLDSFVYLPTAGRDEYIKAHPHQSDYLTVKTGKVSVGPFDVERYIRDTILDMGVVNISDGFLTNYRDKRIPREPGLVKPLPVNFLKKISTHLIADTFHVKNGRVEYKEVHEKTAAEGSITVARLNGTITHMRNFNLNPGDSLDIKATAYLEDTILTKLTVKESYTDSLGGFLMTTQMGKGDLTVLNPILTPLASAELRSGYLDTMSMRVVGREFLAFGEMKMYYHGLKVKVTRPGKKSFFTSLATFLANTLIKNENSHRTGTVFFQRWRDRSPINYLVKIALSGMSSSIGIKKSKKQARKYRHEIRSKKLPPAHLL